MAVGLLLPLPSRYHRQAKLDHYQRETAEPSQKLRQYLFTLPEGAPARAEHQRQLKYLQDQQAQVNNRLVPEVNAAIELHRRRRQQSWLAVGGGVALLVLGQQWARRRRGSPLDHLDPSFDPAEVETPFHES